MTEQISSSRSSAPMWLGNLEPLARASAAAAAAAYLFGFMIVTLHHSRLGIWDFELLKPRMLSAGFTYLLLTALAVAHGFGLHGLTGIGGVGLPWPEHKHRAAGHVIRLCSAVGGAYGYAVFFRGIVAQNETMRFWIPWAPLIALLVSALAVPEFARRHIDQHPGWLMFCAILTAAATWFVIVRTASPFTVALAIWFYGVMILAVLVYAVLHFREELLINQRLESWLIAAVLALVYFYSGYVYPSMNPWLGGGAPSPITLTLKSPSTPLKARLLEETEHGFYVLPESSPETPVFMPRDSVAEIRFAHPPS